jgi:hypothetical protein
LRLQAVQFGASEAALKQFNEAMETGTEYQKRMAAAVLANSIEEKKQEK